MKFLRLGIAAAMAMALCGQLAQAAGVPTKMDQKIHDQSVKDAPALVQASGLKCDVTDAYLLGGGDEKVNGKSYKSSIYEIACGMGGMGYVFKSAPGTDAVFYDCLSLQTQAAKNAAAAPAPNPKDKKAAAAAESSSTTCGLLPANADPKQGLKAWLTEGGVTCPTLDQGAWLGSSTADKINVYEAKCGGVGYLMITPMPGSPKKLDVEPCIKSDLLGLKCTLTTEAEMDKPVFAAAAQANKPNCMPTKARWVVTDNTTGNDFYEVGCADGKSSFMIRMDSNGAFK